MKQLIKPPKRQPDDIIATIKFSRLSKYLSSSVSGGKETIRNVLGVKIIEISNAFKTKADNLVWTFKIRMLKSLLKTY